MKDFGGRVAAITGAGSGIGRALAIDLAGRGCHLALSDVDEPGLADTAARAGKTGAVTITQQRVDVADQHSVEQWADTAVTDHGSVNLIINNAGVALTTTVEAMSYENLRWLMDVNFFGVVHGTKAFLPHLKAAGDGHVVNISSVFGLVGIPSQSAYNASKFAVRGFTEALRLELDAEDCGVSATTIHPGGIKTNIVVNGRWEDDETFTPSDRADAVERFEQAARTTPERAAVLILNAVEKNKRRAMIGGDARVFDMGARLPPWAYQRVIGRLGRRMADGQDEVPFGG